MLPFNEFPVLETDRLILCEKTLSDAAAIYALQNADGVLKYLDQQPYQSLSEAQAFIEKITKGIARKDWVSWKICLKGTDLAIGTICLWMVSADGTSCDVGYTLHPDHWGKGYMQEALKKVSNYGLNHLGLKIIQAYTHKNNQASIALAKKVGYVFNSNDGDHVIYTFGS